MLLSSGRWPFGVVTILLVVAALAVQFWPQSSCEQLKSHLGGGYFMSWQEPNLILITKDKTQLNVQADSQEKACEALLGQLASKDNDSIEIR